MDVFQRKSTINGERSSVRHVWLPEGKHKKRGPTMDNGNQLESPQWRFLTGKIIELFSWRTVQLAMFDYRRVMVSRQNDFLSFLVNHFAWAILNSFAELIGDGNPSSNILNLPCHLESSSHFRDIKWDKMISQKLPITIPLSLCPYVHFSVFFKPQVASHNQTCQLNSHHL